VDKDSHLTSLGLPNFRFFSWCRGSEGAGQSDEAKSDRPCPSEDKCQNIFHRQVYPSVLCQVNHTQKGCTGHKSSFMLNPTSIVGVCVVHSLTCARHHWRCGTEGLKHPPLNNGCRANQVWSPHWLTGMW